MQLAELDLTLRGPGERYGTSQHGRWDLKIADFSDLKLLEKARQVADQFPDLLNSLSTFKILLAN
jgi:RecG-like helicase